MTTTVAVFGSCNMDLVAYVSTAPKQGETLHGKEFRMVPGGKGANQAVAAASAGAAVHMIGAVGSDDLGDRLRANLDGHGVDTRGLRTIDGNSGTAHIVVDDEGGNSIVVVAGANGTVEDLASGDEDLLADSQVLLLQLETPLAGVRRVAAAAQRAGTTVVLTPAPAAELPDELLADVDLLVPNEHEAAVLTGCEDPRRALPRLLERVPEVAITLGSQGVLYGTRNGPPVAVPAYSVRPVDTTAAGDTFVGVLSVARSQGLGTTEELRRASAAAALSVQRNGAGNSMPSGPEIDEFLRRNG